MLRFSASLDHANIWKLRNTPEVWNCKTWNKPIIWYLETTSFELRVFWTVHSFKNIVIRRNPSQKTESIEKTRIARGVFNPVIKPVGIKTGCLSAMLCLTASQNNFNYNFFFKCFHTVLEHGLFVFVYMYISNLLLNRFKYKVRPI